MTIEGGVQVHLATGGHPQPLLRRADGRVDTVPLGGSLLGVFTDPVVHALDVRLEAGDLLVLVTDGVLEARWNGEQFGVEGLVEVLSRGDLDSAESAALAVETAVG